MDAVPVVGLEVLLEVALERRLLRHERTRKRRPPALLEDRELQALDVAIRGGRPALMKRWRAPSSSTASPNSLARNAEPLSVITRSSFQPATASSQATRCTSALQWRALGFFGEACSCPGEVRAHVDRRVLPDGSLRAREAADEEAIHADELSGRCTSMWRSGGAIGGLRS
jgi:hypothetical protein